MPEFARALTDEEWIQFADSRDVLMKLAEGKRPYGPTRRFTDEQKMHAVAALALHGQSFGFTRQEHDALTEALRVLQLYLPVGPVTPLVRSVQEKIAALLPPRPPGKP